MVRTWLANTMPICGADRSLVGRIWSSNKGSEVMSSDDKVITSVSICKTWSLFKCGAVRFIRFQINSRLVPEDRTSDLRHLRIMFSLPPLCKLASLEFLIVLEWTPLPLGNIPCFPCIPLLLRQMDNAGGFK